VSDYRELTALRDRLSRAKAQIRTAVMSDMDKAAEQVKEQMRQLVPVDTGTLRDSIAVVKDGSTYHIGPVGVEYAKYVEYGTKPHVIMAKAGGVLAFQVGGSTRYAKSVKHPGTKAQPYIRPAKQWAIENLTDDIAVTGASLLAGKPKLNA
jgi:HK97 gp10 family phage protein